MTTLATGLTGDEITALKGYKDRGYPSITRKASAMLLINSGVDIVIVADFVDRKPSTINTWIREFNATRLASIFSFHIGNSNASKLTPQQRQHLEQVLSQPPSAQGIPGRFWTVPTIRDWMISHLDVDYASDTSIQMILKHAGCRFKLPGSVDKNRADQQLIDQRMEQIRHQIQQPLTEEDHMVFAADEVRLEHEAEIRKAWIHRDDPGTVQVDRVRQAQSYCGFLDHNTGKVDLFTMNWQNTENIIAVLRELTLRYPKKKFTIVWDNAKWHRAKALRELLGDGNEFAHIYLVWMPAYAPDKNPIEKVWNEAKNALANNQRLTFEQTTTAFETFITSSTFNYRL